MHVGKRGACGLGAPGCCSHFVGWASHRNAREQSNHMVIALNAHSALHLIIPVDALVQAVSLPDHGLPDSPVHTVSVRAAVDSAPSKNSMQCPYWGKLITCPGCARLQVGADQGFASCSDI